MVKFATVKGWWQVNTNRVKYQGKRCNLYVRRKNPVIMPSGSIPLWRRRRRQRVGLPSAEHARRWPLRPRRPPHARRWPLRPRRPPYVSSGGVTHLLRWCRHHRARKDQGHWGLSPWIFQVLISGLGRLWRLKFSVATVSRFAMILLSALRSSS
jgi:hypothetical protein